MAEIAHNRRPADVSAGGSESSYSQEFPNGMRNENVRMVTGSGNVQQLVTSLGIGSGIGVWCSDLSYTVRQKKILENLTVCAEPGEFTVVMGPSGAGKTTLLNCLLNRVRSGGVSGERGLNAEFASKNLLKAHARYVMQYDITLSYLTVKETLRYSANLRMPNCTNAEREEAVTRVIRWMELQDCQDTYCGGEWRKGISKGQMKRLAIAQELLGDPPILVLDEPTTGLDSCLALELVSILRRVARESGKTIIASIHQPSQRAFEEFDKLILISGGGLLYYGPANQAVNYFASMGKECPAGFSPPDFLLELATDETFTSSRIVKRRQQEQKSLTVSTSVPKAGHAVKTDEAENEFPPSTSSDKVKLDATVDNYSSIDGADMKGTLTPYYSTAHELELMRKRYLQRDEHERVLGRIESLKKLPFPRMESRTAKGNNWRFEFSTIWKRSTLNNLRNPMTSFVIILVNIVQALILGALFFQLQSDVSEGSITYTQVRDYEFWNSAVVQFLAYGLDKSGSDPFLDMIYNGVNNETGANLLFDVLVHPKLVTYLGDLMNCTRTLYGDIFFDPSGVNYPQWHWPVGSIVGSSITNADGPTSPQAVDSTIASMPLESFSNTVMAAVQLLDYWITDKRPVYRLMLPDLENAGLPGFWMSVFAILDTYVSPLFCCMGLGFGAGLTGAGAPEPIDCPTVYPGYTFPELPGPRSASAGLEIVQSAKEWINSDGMRRLLTEISSQVSTSTKKTLAEVKEDQRSRNILTPTTKSAKVTRTKKLAPNGGWSRSRESGSVKNGAPKRRLGSGLGGMVTDIWEQLFNNQDSPLYDLTNSLISWFNKFEDCDNSYCTAVVDMYNNIKDELSNLANSFLTVLNIAGAVFFCCANLGFSAYEVLLQFPKDRAVFNRERANGLYRTSSYFFAKMLSDLPFQLIPCILWTIVFYFMIGLASSANQFFAFLGIGLLVSFACYSLGYMTSAFAARLEVAVVVAPLVLVIMLTFAGFFLRDDAMPVGIAWLKYFSIFRWGFFSLNAIQFPPGGSFGSMDNNLSLAIIGVTVPQVWISVLALIAQAALFRVLGYVGLRWCNRSVGMEA